jgi:GNAT superfamily N-acetyltransferase
LWVVPWEFTDDVEVYAEHAWDLLAVAPVANTVALTVIESVRAGRRWSEDPMLFGWYEAGLTAGAVSMTPPYELLLAAVPDDAAGELVSGLRARAVRTPGVNGDIATADRFAAAWTASSPLRATAAMRLRLYVLGTLRPPTPPPPGRPRRAGQGDFADVAGWFTAFQSEGGVHAVDVAPVVRDRIEAGLVWLWEDTAGTAVSMAARNRTAASVARVAPVYTPPEHRQHGYGTAVTAACTRDALDQDAEHVVLFTDLANPTSNAIYQQIGYRPLRDQQVIHFVA